MGASRMVFNGKSRFPLSLMHRLDGVIPWCFYGKNRIPAPP
jgi:hypothetical protein